MIERSPTQALLEEIDRDNAAAWNDLQASPSNALKASQATLAKAQVAGYRKGCADAHLNIGWCEYHLGKLADAYTSYGKSLALYDASADNEGSCKALNAIGVYYHEISRLDKSIDFYTQSLERAKKAGLLYRQLVAMANIGDLCLSLGNPKEALDYLLKAYEMRSDDITPELALTILINIGKSFFELGNNALAL